MECQEISKVHKNSNYYFDSVLENVLNNPNQYKINEKEKYHVKIGDYLKLNTKCIWVAFYYENHRRCRIAGYIENDRFIIWSMICTPQQTGLGSRTLELLNLLFQETRCDLSIFVVDVWPTAINFWKKMKQRKLIVDFKEYLK